MLYAILKPGELAGLGSSRRSDRQNLRLRADGDARGLVPLRHLLLLERVGQSIVSGILQLLDYIKLSAPNFGLST